MNRMIGFGLAWASSITDFSRFSNSPFTPAPACNKPRSSVRSVTSFSAGRHVASGDAQREAFDHRGLADAGFTGEDRVVLPPAGQDVDDLADFQVAAQDRIDPAGARPRGQIDGELIKCRCPRPRRCRTIRRRTAGFSGAHDASQLPCCSPGSR